MPSWVAWGLGVILALIFTFRIEAIQHLLLRLVGREPKAAARLAPAPGETPVELLGQRITHLELVTTWMKNDPDFARLIDSSIGRQVKMSEQREKVYSAFLGIGMLIAGWLISAVSPNILTMLFR